MNEETIVTEATETVDTGPQEVIIVEAPRPFLTTSFEDYTVQEGFSLLICVLLLILVFLDLIRWR